MGLWISSLIIRHTRDTPEEEFHEAIQKIKPQYIEFTDEDLQEDKSWG